MTKTLTLSLGSYWNDFIKEELELGRYSSASELVRDALRLLEEREAESKLDILKSKMIEVKKEKGSNSVKSKKIKRKPQTHIA